MKLRRSVLIVPFLLVLAGGLGLAASPRPAAAQPDLAEARAVVEQVSQAGIENVIKAPIPHEERIARFRDLFVEHFDSAAIARFVLGRHWRSADPKERERFNELFREVNVYTWSRRFKDYSGQKLRIGNVEPDGDKGAFVDTLVEQTGDQKPLKVRWRLRQRSEGWRVVDLVVEGVSMAITYRSEYNSLLSDPKVDLAKLNSLLERQIEKLKAQQEG